MAATFQKLIDGFLAKRLDHGCSCASCIAERLEAAGTYTCNICGYNGKPITRACVAVGGLQAFMCPLCHGGQDMGAADLLHAVLEHYWQLPKQVIPSCTASGHAIWYHDPDRTPIVDDDVFQGLVRKSRFDSVVRSSILLHLALVVEILRSWNAPKETVRAGACHDLHEAFIGEWHAGLKQACPDLKALEHPWEEKFHRHYGVAWPVPADVAALVKKADILSCTMEMFIAEHPRRNFRLKEHGSLSREEADIVVRVASMSEGSQWLLVLGALKHG